MELIMQMLGCLIVTLLAGILIGWLLKSLFGGSGDGDGDSAGLRARIGSLEADLKACRESQSKSANLATAGSMSGTSDAEVAGLKAKLSECESEKSFLMEQVKKAESGVSIKRELPESEWDDLEAINGVGPVLERMLYSMGIYTFREIAGWDAAKIAEIDAKLPQFKGRIEREGWVQSAKEEHFKKYGERI